VAKVPGSLVSPNKRPASPALSSTEALFGTMTTRRGMNARGHSRLNSSTAVPVTDELGNLNREEGLSEVEALRRDLDASERENNRVQYSSCSPSRCD